MKPRKLFSRALAIGLAIYAARVALLVADDWQRYDRIRRMSDQPPFGSEIPQLAADTMAAEGATVCEIASFIRSMPFEVMRYLRIQAM